jgi:4-alpha-glucanotransferase
VRAHGTASVRSLRELARLYAVQPAYYDIIARRRRQASAESLLLVLRALGAPVELLRDAPAAVRERSQALADQLMEPVAVLSGGKGTLVLCLPEALAGASLAAQLKLEDGRTRSWEVKLARLPVRAVSKTGGSRYLRKRLHLPLLPVGYHQLRLEANGRSAETLLLCPPAGAYAPDSGPASRTWGVFLPLHALRTARSWAGGDFGDLERLYKWVSDQGGGVVATLPFLAAFLDHLCHPSPYAPVSRLFWNEFFLDIERIAELQASPGAQRLLASANFQRGLGKLRATPLVNYRRGMALKRKVLEKLAQTLLSGRSRRRTAFESFVESHPLLQEYARFRAVQERRRTSWRRWPQRLRDGRLEGGDYNEDSRAYHLYVQWLCHAQLSHFSRKARLRGPGLYLDLPLGVHPDGYDVWRQRALFAQGVSGGAPPDSFFTKGQNWGFPPLHPERIREEGYRYFIACLRHHLRYAGILRIDHVMGLHRLFWVPEGMKAIEGVYVGYHAPELYAILAIESQRHQALIVGEDLGTVPPYVRPAMARHKIHRIYVAQYEVNPQPLALRAVRQDSLASLNTHDMPTFAGFWQGLDIEDRVRMRLLRRKKAPKEHRKRYRIREALARFLQRRVRLGPGAELMQVLQACLVWLARSRARVVTLNLEDLWGETHPQNVPGTTSERPNWRRKARLSFEEFSRQRFVRETLAKVEAARHRKKKIV